MEKSKILIASSGKTLPLAEVLMDALQTGFCEARLWSEQVVCHASDPYTSMLANPVAEFDFAAILLAKEDMIVAETHDALKALAKRVFEAGFFIATLGRERCFLVNSVKQSDLPSDFGGIMSIPFEEPADLTDRNVCAQSFAQVAAVLKERMQHTGRSACHAHVPLLSFAELFERERPLSDGGCLREGQIVVCDTQPMAGVELTLQVYRNMNNGIFYHYFLYFSDDTLDKVFQALQVMSAIGAGCTGSATDFLARVSTVKNQKHRVLEVLRNMCSSGSLRLTLLTDEPQPCFRVHNASNTALARYYARYFEHGYVLWAEGRNAVALWQQLPKWLVEDRMDRLFIPLKQNDPQVDTKDYFERSLVRALGRYFPGIEGEVRQVFIGGAS